MINKNIGIDYSRIRTKGNKDTFAKLVLLASSVTIVVGMFAVLKYLGY